MGRCVGRNRVLSVSGPIAGEIDDLADLEIIRISSGMSRLNCCRSCLIFLGNDREGIARFNARDCLSGHVDCRI